MMINQYSFLVKILQFDFKQRSGLRLLCFGYSSNRIRDDLLRRRQCDVFRSFRHSDEIHRQIFYNSFRNRRAHGNI